jgi:hypothetical protein
LVKILHTIGEIYMSAEINGKQELKPYETVIKGPSPGTVKADCPDHGDFHFGRISEGSNIFRCLHADHTIGGNVVGAVYTGPPWYTESSPEQPTDR